MSKCFPSTCRCCECNHKHCLVWHPGHSHKITMVTDLLQNGLDAMDDGYEKMIFPEEPSGKKS